MPYICSGCGEKAKLSKKYWTEDEITGDDIYTCPFCGKHSDKVELNEIDDAEEEIIWDLMEAI